MPTGRPTKPLDLTPEEIEKLTTLARRRKTSQALAIRARIVLGCGDGTSNGVVARRLGITAATVCKCESGFGANGWRDCWMSPARVHHGPSATHRWKK